MFDHAEKAIRFACGQKPFDLSQVKGTYAFRTPDAINATNDFSGAGTLEDPDFSDSVARVQAFWTPMTQALENLNNIGYGKADSVFADHEEALNEWKKVMLAFLKVRLMFPDEFNDGKCHTGLRGELENFTNNDIETTKKLQMLFKQRKSGRYDSEFALATDADTRKVVEPGSEDEFIDFKARLLKVWNDYVEKGGPLLTEITRQMRNLYL